MIWLTSDLHFNHDKDFIWKERGFNSIEEMNQEIINRFNSKIESNDTVYILGDLCLGGPDSNFKNYQLLEQLNGNIYIILGNHDTVNRQCMYAMCGNIVNNFQYADMITYNKYHFYLSHYPTLTSNLDADKPLKQRTLNLFGHTHQKEKFYNDNPTMYNVGVDAHDCYPVNIETIIEDMKSKSIVA